MKNETKNRMLPGALKMAALVAALLFAPGAMAGQHGPPDGRTGERLQERMVELRSKLLRKRVGLNDAQIARVEAVLEKGDAERKAAHQAVKRNRKALRELVEGDSTDEKAFDAAVSGLLDARDRLHKHRHGELSKLRRMLSAREMGKLVLALGRLRHKRNRMDDGHRRRGPDDARRGKRGDRERRGRRGGRHHRDDW